MRSVPPPSPREVSNRWFHLALNVRDLRRSVDFYRVFLDRDPAKLHGDYAQFRVDDPPLVLSLNPQPHEGGGSLNHLGMRVSRPEDLVAVQRRLEEAGFTTQREDGVPCCYARQTKFWVADPDRNLWETYVVEADLPEKGAAAPPTTASEL